MKRQPTELLNIFVIDICHKGLIYKIYKELIQLIIKKTNNSVKKMSKGPEYTLLQRGHTADQQKYEKMLNITNYERNANEISPHTCHNKSTNNMCWRGCAEKGTLVNHWWE